MVREATTPQGTDVHFDAPTPTGGREPYSVQCDPGSSSIFAIGETAVRCTATDADMARGVVWIRRHGSCISDDCEDESSWRSATALRKAPCRWRRLIMLGPPDTYPFKLEQMLLERYPSQSIVVVNEGAGGEDTRGGARRLPQVLEADNPEVLLLLEGINNLGASTATQVTALRTMITEAQSRGVDVIIATVMPVLPTWRQYQPGTTLSKIQALNTQIFAARGCSTIWGFPLICLRCSMQIRN